MSDEPTPSAPGEKDATPPVAVPASEPESSQEVAETPEVTPDSAESAEPLVDPPEPQALSVVVGSVSDLERLIKNSFISPEATKAACRSLIDSCDDKGLWLASAVQPSYLVQELHHGCSDLSTLVIMQWVRQGETHKLKQLGDLLLVAEPKATTHESAQIMTVIAGLLGILRPVLAQRLLTTATAHMSDAEDNGLLRDARKWVDAGSLLEGCLPEQRVFWNRRLREPNADWDWESAESRLALNQLAAKRPEDDADLILFQNTLPGCWWDLWRSRSATPSSSATTPIVPTKSGKGGFLAGALVGLAAALAVGWLAGPEASAPVVPAPVAPAVAEVAPPPPSPPAPPVVEPLKLIEEEVPAPPIRESLRHLQAVLRQKTEAPAASKGVAAQPPPTIPPATVMRAQRTATDGSPPEKETTRKQQIQTFAQDNGDIKRLFSMVKEGSYRENERLIRGMNSMAPGGSTTYQKLIHWLLLDPPAQADARLVVTKMALRALPIDEVVSVFDLCHYPGSPNEIEIKECSHLLLELPINGMTTEHKDRLTAITGSP